MQMMFDLLGEKSIGAANNIIFILPMAYPGSGFMY